MNQQQRYLLLDRESGLCAMDITFTQLGDPSRILQEMATNQTAMLPSVGRAKIYRTQFGEHLDPDERYEVSAQVKLRQNQVIKATVFAPMPYLSILTHWKIDESEGKAYPYFEPVDGTFHGVKLWHPPANTTLWLAVNTTRSGPTWIHEGSHLGLYITGAGWYRLPLPNIHTDARLCLGNHFSDSPSLTQGTMIGVWLNVYNTVQDWAMNMDLSDEPNLLANAKNMFRAGPDDTLIESVGNYRDYLYPVSNVNLNVIPQE